MCVSLQQPPPLFFKIFVGPQPDALEGVLETLQRPLSIPLIIYLSQVRKAAPRRGNERLAQGSALGIG